ncbi:MAG: glycogen/starch synthase, partial [Bacteroidales bacterium]|nr:glycogen/starch synthase [Bacteroidales bacterium]
MRVLMFGWEFPPHIAGGLGTACEGIVKGLAYNGVETIFVMPSASGDEDQSCTRIINASDVPVDTVSTSVDEFLDRVKFVHIGTNMVPYADPEEFSRLVEEDRLRQVKDFSVSYGQKYKFSGKYGANLMEEVARYAMVGGTIALRHKDEFDVIHAHDWLTYYAGIAAKELTGKPLVVHVHATSYDRGSVDNIDTRVLAIETRGMEMADRVVTVSDLTRNIV